MRTIFRNPLEELYAELECVEQMTEAQVMAAYNADSKDEIIELILEDIESARREAHRNPSDEHRDHDDEGDDHLEEERTALCISQGLARYC